MVGSTKDQENSTASLRGALVICMRSSIFSCLFLWEHILSVKGSIRLDILNITGCVIYSISFLIFLALLFSGSVVHTDKCLSLGDAGTVRSRYFDYSTQVWLSLYVVHHWSEFRAKINTYSTMRVYRYIYRSTTQPWQAGRMDDSPWWLGKMQMQNT